MSNSHILLVSIIVGLLYFVWSQGVELRAKDNLLNQISDDISEVINKIESGGCRRGIQT